MATHVRCFRSGSVHAIETTGRTNPKQVLSLRRSRLLRRYIAPPEPTTVDRLIGSARTRRLDRMETCASLVYVVWIDGDPQLRYSSCKLRYCPRCSAILSWRRSLALTTLLTTYKTPVFLTLTLKSVDEPLKKTISRLVSSFNRLRRCAVWKQQAGRGFYAVEVTRNAVTKLWHVHLHTVVDCEYIPQAWIANQWEKITGDSRIVHIRKAKPADAGYMAKYMTKAATMEVEDAEQWETIDQMRGLRLMASFGGERSIGSVVGELTPAEQEDTRMVPLTELYHAAHYDQKARESYHLLSTRNSWMAPTPEWKGT